ncbi:FixH family protein [Desertibaculum subflavum]|uniref:FixH family protein n=1 Tax=Desertibaculum subflavum TaxID=2268458 RepID=UPI0013C46593
MRWMLPALLAALISGTTHAADRAEAEVTCLPTRDKLVYDCLVRLTNLQSKAAVAGAEVMVSADMPSMPMAHNVRPVSAAPIRGEPGVYGFRLHLEMQGEWALKIGVNKPFRDLVVRVLEFGPTLVQPKR